MLFQKRQAAGIFCFSGIVICQRYSQIDTQLVKGTQVVAAELGTVKDPPPYKVRGSVNPKKLSICSMGMSLKLSLINLCIGAAAGLPRADMVNCTTLPPDDIETKTGPCGNDSGQEYGRCETAFRWQCIHRKMSKVY
jgi:hypothetical protein